MTFEINAFHVAIVFIICYTFYYTYKRKREYDAGLYKRKSKDET